MFAGDGNIIDYYFVFLGSANRNQAFFPVELFNLGVFQLQDQFDQGIILSPIYSPRDNNRVSLNPLPSLL